MDAILMEIGSSVFDVTDRVRSESASPVDSVAASGQNERPDNRYQLAPLSNSNPHENYGDKYPAGRGRTRPESGMLWQIVYFAR